MELNVIEQFVQQAPFVAFVPMLSRWHTITARLAGWRLESSRNRRAFLVGALAAFWKFLGSVKSIFKGATRRGPFFQRKKFSAEILLCCLITGTAEAQTSVNLAWDASRSGTVMGYRLYEGTQSGHYGQMIDAGNALSATIPNLAAGTTYYFVATVYDSNGSESLPSNEVSFPVSGLFNSDTPANITWNDPNPVEVGVKFQSALAGQVTGLRFYKALKNIGTHVGNLWTDTGTLLASATFANETADGWQEVNVPTPVTLIPGQTYIASYHTDGYYSADPAYFASDHLQWPLLAPASGGNGVFSYGISSLFPTNTYHSINYWVDIVFNQFP